MQLVSALVRAEKCVWSVHLEVCVPHEAQKGMQVLQVVLRILQQLGAGHRHLHLQRLLPQ